MRIYPSQVGDGRVAWLLTVQWAGLTIRVADEECDVETDDGEVYHFDGTLEPPSVTEEVSLGGDASGTLSIPITAFFPGVNVPLLVARGHRLSAARGELSRWVVGTTWERRRTVLVGQVSDPEHGEEGEAVRFSLEENIADEAARTGSPGQRILGANFEHADTIPVEDLGLDYPLLIGRPGDVSTAVNATKITGSYAPWIDYRRTPAASGGNMTEIRAIIAGHHVGFNYVGVNTDTDPGTLYQVRVYNGFDDQGRPIAALAWFHNVISGTAPEDDYDEATYDYVYASGSYYGLGSAALPTSFNGSTPTRLYISGYDESEPTAGGLTVAGRVVREAPDLLQYLLGLTSRPIDRPRFQSATVGLSRFAFDGVIVERTGIWPFLRDEILSLLPVSLASGPSGVYPIVWRFDATANDATVRINADLDPTTARVSTISEDGGERYNRIVVRYGYSFRSMTYLGELTLGAAEDEASAGNPALFRVNPYCQASRDALGTVREKVVESAFVYSDATAYAIAEWMAAAYALPDRTVQYSVLEADYIHVERGAVALVTDERVYLDEALALVTEVVTDGSGVLTLTLRLLDRPGLLGYYAAA